MAKIEIGDLENLPYKGTEKDILMWLKGFLDALPPYLDVPQTAKLKNVIDAYFHGVFDDGFDPTSVLTKPNVSFGKMSSGAVKPPQEHE